MKALFGTLMFSCVLQASLVAQSGFSDVNNLFVWSKSGLTLRKGSSSKAPKIKTLPYGTKVSLLKIKGQVTFDSVVVIPSGIDKRGGKAPTFVLHGYWAYVASGQDTGHVFNGYLSSMPPFQPTPPSETSGAPYESISTWLAQTVGILDTRKISEYDDDYTQVYQNHVVEYLHTGEGGGSLRYTFQHDMGFHDGFLLLNYFEGLHFRKEDIEACDIFDLTLGDKYLNLRTVGLGEGLYWGVLLSWRDGLLIIEVGQGC